MRSARRCAAWSSATSRAPREVVENDKKLDALEIETERRAVQLIALRAPMAGDLRDVVAALKISGVVERIGDYAKNIAKRVPLLDERQQDRAAVAAAGNGADRDRAWSTTCSTPSSSATPMPPSQVCERDDAVDDFYNSIFRTLLTYMMENPHNIGQSTHLLFVAKNLERVGDHATNIAEMVYYAATGQHMADRPQRHESLADMADDMAPSACCWSRTTGRWPSWSNSTSSRAGYRRDPHRRRRGSADPGRRGQARPGASSTG